MTSKEPLGDLVCSRDGVVGMDGVFLRCPGEGVLGVTE